MENYTILILAIIILLVVILIYLLGRKRNQGQTNLEEQLKRYEQEISILKSEKDHLLIQERDLHSGIAVKSNELNNEVKRYQELKQVYEELHQLFKDKQLEINSIKEEKAKTQASYYSMVEQSNEYKITIKKLNDKIIDDAELIKNFHKENSSLLAKNQHLEEKLDIQKKEIIELQKNAHLQFEKIANQILEEKTEKFTLSNSKNLESILKPLSENLDKFKKQVEDVYVKEAQQRFSLEKEVKNLVLLNTQISEEANNLTKALKGDSKIQGDWGEMILENILEKSGLTENREYFIQRKLKNEDGKTHMNEFGKIMQPDVVIAYPDDRKIIIDSKVSIKHYAAYIAAENKIEQQSALEAHLRSMKTHINDLSKKSYQDFAKTLDFVMMFVPNEPAYFLALQHDPELWNDAYKKRILLISPTNLIASLKLIADLWKREQQNLNAQEIAKRGTALYDKFVGFVEDLNKIGTQINQTQKTYDDALNKLKSGRGNLLSQVEMMKRLGIKSQKQIPSNLLNVALSFDSQEKGSDQLEHPDISLS